MTCAIKQRKSCSVAQFCRLVEKVETMFSFRVLQYCPVLTLLLISIKNDDNICKSFIIDRHFSFQFSFKYSQLWELEPGTIWVWFPASGNQSVDDALTAAWCCVKETATITKIHGHENCIQTPPVLSFLWLWMSLLKAPGSRGFELIFSQQSNFLLPVWSFFF